MEIVIDDPFGVTADTALPGVALALDPERVQVELQQLPRLCARDHTLSVRSIRVTRHKPGRRCVIEYGVHIEGPRRLAEESTVIGKLRAGHDGTAACALMLDFWASGFAADSRDGISVPDPLGEVPALSMWLQEKVPGVSAGQMLGRPEAPALMTRLAEAAFKVHGAAVPTTRQHGMADELAVLDKCLAMAQAAAPAWADRIARVLERSRRIGALLRACTPQTIHRDFYHDQVIVAGERLYLIDFDCYCWGDPALDIGNFVAHLTELSLRTRGDPGALAHLEAGLIERYTRLAGKSRHPAIEAYTLLTLARHIYLSLRMPERRATAEAVLELCEERLKTRDKL